MSEVALSFLQQFALHPPLQNQYIFSLAILLFFAVAAKVLLLTFNLYLRRMAHKTKTNIDDLLFKYTRKPLFYLVMAYGLKIALLNIDINGLATQLVTTLMAVVFIFILSRVLDVIIES